MLWPPINRCDFASAGVPPSVGAEKGADHETHHSPHARPGAEPGSDDASRWIRRAWSWRSGVFRPHPPLSTGRLDRDGLIAIAADPICQPGLLRSLWRPGWNNRRSDLRHCSPSGASRSTSVCHEAGSAPQAVLRFRFRFSGGRANRQQQRRPTLAPPAGKSVIIENLFPSLAQFIRVPHGSTWYPAAYRHGTVRHSQMSLTSDLYSHVASAMLDDAADALCRAHSLRRWRGGRVCDALGGYAFFAGAGTDAGTVFGGSRP